MHPRVNTGPELHVECDRLGPDKDGRKNSMDRYDTYSENICETILILRYLHQLLLSPPFALQIVGSFIQNWFAHRDSCAS